MMMARMKALKPLTAANAAAIPLPTPIPNGPSRNAVSGTMISRERNGTNTMCTDDGMIFFRPFSTQNNPMAAMSGGNTCPE
jgi:hypothetical protein